MPAKESKAVEKEAPVGFKLPKWVPRMSHDKQDTLLKLLVLSIAAILCMFTVLYIFY